jgi:proton-translocating NADH-quinone oxidoreductase chain L
VAFLIVLGITRPLAVRAKKRLARATGGSAGGAQGATATHDPDPHATHGADAGHGEHGDQGEHEGHEGHEPVPGQPSHGAPTPFWESVSAWITVLGMLLAFGEAVAILIQFIGSADLQRNGYTLNLYDWFTFGNLHYTIAFRVDPLTVIMLIVVTLVSLLVHLYSVGYMAGDASFSRFFIELSLFTVSMLILVLAANFLVLFIGWELVGLSSYLLIGFWYAIPDPPPAALKAFVTTRFGDFFFLIGILVLFFTTGTFDFNTLNGATSHVDQFTVTLAMILVFCGAVGKSAQFPLHVWLPDAMEGPTPVSALIHAATMVAAGVYLVARLFPIYAHVAGPQSLLVVGYVGGFTALFAATIALVQNDIKRVLAYSTVSQLGYMFVGLAVADTNAVGIFHLFTHAFFKALLFLGSGSVIHAVTTQDMRDMGGLARRMPVTAGTFLVATLAISGIPPFAGFFSKDDIIGHAFTAGQGGIWGGYALYALTLSAAVLTAFYMFRLFFMTFGGHGAALFGLWGNDRQARGETHAHESPWTMTVPLVVLAIPAFAAGWLIFRGFGTFLNHGTTVAVENPFLNGMTYIGIAAAVIGILLAWLMYAARPSAAGWYKLVPGGAWVYTLLVRKYYIDELYLWLVRIVILGLSRAAAGFDALVIDGIVNGSARGVRDLGKVTSHSETGRVQNYAAVFFAGAVVLVIALFVGVALTVK